MALPTAAEVLAGGYVFHGVPFVETSPQGLTAAPVFRGQPFDAVVDAPSNITYQCIVLVNGALAEYDGVSGQRVILSGGALVCQAVGGTSLVFDRTTGRIREAAAGETVVTP